MTHTEIITRMKYTKKAMAWTYQDIAIKSGYHKDIVLRAIHGRNVGVIAFVDIVTAMGLEINVI